MGNSGTHSLLWDIYIYIYIYIFIYLFILFIPYYGICALSWVMQGVYHQPYTSSFPENMTPEG